MDIKDVVTAYHQRGAEVIEFVYSFGTHANAAEQIARTLLMPIARARAMMILGKAMYGPCPRHEKRQVREANTILARRMGVGLEMLLMIHSQVKQLSLQAPLTREELRAELLALSKEMSVDEMRAHAARRVQELNPGGVRRECRYLRFSRSIGADGLRAMMVRLPEQEMMRVREAVDARVQATWRSGSNRRHEQARADALHDLLAGASVVGEVPVRRLEPTIVITTRDAAGEVIDTETGRTFGLSDGSTMTLEEYASIQLADTGYVVVCDADNAPVNAYRIQRLANWKQRHILEAEQLVCGNANCGCAGNMCQVHHIKPWEQGGETNLANLMLLCPTCHARVDRDPEWKLNGYNGRDPDGRTWHQDPNGKRRYTMLPIRKLGIRGVAATL
ncbi:DUF222 domain-containing protein [Corynebacterium poyangense]|uniref:DUF222 domain-containing protein n=1 Tax=Corynebacterium poyangense TaxID=2684405 RepID=A0A7H0SRB5_9CORY|nr:HNH endonuclease signature motif containing protein [Corynebacterium poyangense]MBZ8176524.1 DUF222 domain-containing protein [Corynebacterium poyangense]QNQ91090.1 DUF222 domain-containing protein [Corynebacterium poyangense]